MMTLIEGADYFVRLVPFPPGPIDGAVTPNDDGTFSIYIDSNADDAHRMAALEHELEHIRRDHFYDDDVPVEIIELEADKTSHDTPEPDYATSWRLAMLWSEHMMNLYGWSDKVPAYDPKAWREYAFRHGLIKI